MQVDFIHQMASGGFVLKETTLVCHLKVWKFPQHQIPPTVLPATERRKMNSIAIWSHGAFQTCYAASCFRLLAKSFSLLVLQSPYL